MRWVCLRSCPDGLDAKIGDAGLPGSAAAFEALKAARAAHEMLVLRTGRADIDRLLADMTPALAGLLGDMTARQRAVARMALLEGLRQSEVARRLGVRRATVSVSFARARIQSLAALVSAIRRVFSGAGSAAVEVAGTAASVANGAVAPIAPPS
jgi:DNA-binding CsgD family transcriptional regulator